MTTERRSARVLVVAPVGRDGSLVEAMLVAAGLDATSLPSLDAVVPLLDTDAGALLVTEEALYGDGAVALMQWLDVQPPWSDLPVLLLASNTALARNTRFASAALEDRGNVTLVERPVRARTLARAAHAALRARRRQYDMRAMLDRERETRHEVEAASRAKDEFLATVSHELRTPLNAILGWTRLAQGTRLDEGRRTQALATIERNAVAQAQLIEDLLDVSRIVSGTLRLSMAPVDLAHVVSAARDVNQPAADAKRITITTDIDPSLGSLFGDAARLQQVVWNLVANAVKFSSPGGHVYVCVEARGTEHARIIVRDDGEGIDPAFLPHVFERFRQADGSSTRVHGGLGLGLAIVRSIVELHGGTVTVESAGLGRGASFVVCLPRSGITPSRITHELAAVSAPGSVLSGTRVLIVDDEADARELVATVFEHHDAQPVAVANVRDALIEMRRCTPQILVADIGMPGEDGYSLIRAVRSLPVEHGGRVPALALTAYARATDRARALGAGFDAHLTKPVDVNALLETVAKLLQRVPGPSVAA